MLHEEIKVGQYFYWGRSYGFGYYGKIISVNERSMKIITFDDLQIIEIHLFSGSIRDMRVATIEEVKNGTIQMNMSLVQDCIERLNKYADQLNTELETTDQFNNELEKMKNAITCIQILFGNLNNL